MNFRHLIIPPTLESLRGGYRRLFGDSEPHYLSAIESTARFTLEQIANTDLLYHNVEHTALVTLAGQTILLGKHLVDGGMTSREWTHFIIGTLCHDVGYVRGVCRADTEHVFASGTKDETIEFPVDGTDAILTPIHVDRSKLFVLERFGVNLQYELDGEVIARYMEFTRFPPCDDESPDDPSGLGRLLRAADFVGQLGDPNYLNKVPALFYELQESRTGLGLGYKNPADMRRQYPEFYRTVVRPHLDEAFRYLQATVDGRLWVESLQRHVDAVVSY